jgi:hypothetical protein
VGHRLFWGHYDGLERAAECIVLLKEKARPLIPALTKVVARSKDARAEVRVMAATHLEQLGEKARPGAPSVAALFNDPQRWMREAVTNAMRRIGGLE